RSRRPSTPGRCRCPSAIRGSPASIRCGPPIRRRTGRGCSGAPTSAPAPAIGRRSRSPASTVAASRSLCSTPVWTGPSRSSAAGWQRDTVGGWGVYARTDQLIAGLERAVDPNADGDAHDAARIALVALAEPYGAFAEGPSARAAKGALALDTLVVAPAGNDGA